MLREDIKNFTLSELEKILKNMGEASYRASQIFSWLYIKNADNFTAMKNLPKPLIDKLDRKYHVGKVRLRKHFKSKEGAEKFLFELHDRNLIETVIIYMKKGITMCLSTQVGCKFACSFCASGQMGFVRNLTVSEILNQIMFIQYELKHKISNYVFMGMGEPLDNYDNTIKAIRIMNDPKGLGIGSRRITISTCGIIPAINKLKDMSPQINLSISLHAADNELRNKLVPANKRYPLNRLIDCCQKYIQSTGRIITLEYVLIKGLNDSLDDAEALGSIAKKLKAKVNLIACNQTTGSDYKAPSEKEIEMFVKILKNKIVSATIRKSKGGDIQASCGQLAGKINA